MIKVTIHLNNGTKFFINIPASQEETIKGVSETLAAEGDFMILGETTAKERTMVNKKCVTKIDFKEVCDNHDDESQLVWMDDGWHCKRCNEIFI